jgi:hypothetical protein
MSKPKPVVALRKPKTAIDPAAADAFVASGKTSSSQDVKTSKRPKVEKRRMTIYFDPSVAKRLIVHCAQRDVDLSATVNAAVAAMLGGAAP